MPAVAPAHGFLQDESLALLGRLDAIRPFVLQETMVPAAAVSPAAQLAIERVLVAGRDDLRGRVSGFLRWLRGPGRGATPQEAQRRFATIRMTFNDVISQFDLFSDALTQRSETESGILLAGLDAFAADLLDIPGAPLEAPPLLCYVDRGPGAAIRRARTRLPGGAENPVAIIRVPRERMVGVYGLGASVAHEVGHQAAALLDLVTSLRTALRHHAGTVRPDHRPAWELWERWVSEVLADLFAVARLGVTATLGLIGVVSLPAWVVWRINVNDPHPTPWIRVRLSCAAGAALYPDDRWQRVWNLWRSLYPEDGLSERRRWLVGTLDRTAPELVEVLLAHRAPALLGRPVGEALADEARRPERLLERFEDWRADPERLRTERPALAFAGMGQARLAGAMTFRQEETTLRRLLTVWALRRSVAGAVASAGADAGLAPAPREPVNA